MSVDVQKELEAKFDELFGAFDEDENWQRGHTFLSIFFDTLGHPSFAIHKAKSNDYEQQWKQMFTKKSWLL
mgnify:FL=1